MQSKDEEHAEATPRPQWSTPELVALAIATHTQVKGSEVTEGATTKPAS